MSEIATWLEQLGLGKYQSVFSANEIDLDILPELSEEDLKNLAIPLGSRRNC